MRQFLRSLLSWCGPNQAKRTRMARHSGSVRPDLESLEARDLLSTTPLLSAGHDVMPSSVKLHVLHTHATHHLTTAAHLPVHRLVHSFAAPPSIAGDHFLVYSAYYPGPHRFHNLTVQSLSQTGTTNDGGPLYAATGVWDSRAWSGTVGWHPSLSEFVLDATWTDAGKTYTLDADVTAPSSNWYAGDLQFEGRLNDGNLLSLVHGQQTGRWHLPPSGGTNLAGDFFTVRTGLSGGT
jgi:hypothetical protein